MKGRLVVNVEEEDPELGKGLDMVDVRSYDI